MRGNGMCPFGMGKSPSKCYVGCEIWDNVNNQCSFRSFVGTLEQLVKAVFSTGPIDLVVGEQNTNKKEVINDGWKEKQKESKTYREER